MRLASRTFGLLAAALAGAAIGCGGKSPTEPSATVAQVAGTWTVTSTVTSVSGGECLSGVFQGLVGSRGTGTIQVQQTGSALSVSGDTDAGVRCTYAGTAGSSSISLTATACTAPTDNVDISCFSGAVRRIRHQSSRLDATVSGSTMSGTENLTASITTSQGSSVGTLTINSTFTATKQ
ncbi:MAG: hypothetical protein HY657_07060 [Acidobacteria bacterium]|nr:hypothetical protein [Acidobacteriota bacterium]